MTVRKAKKQAPRKSKTIKQRQSVRVKFITTGNSKGGATSASSASSAGGGGSSSTIVLPPPSTSNVPAAPTLGTIPTNPTGPIIDDLRTTLRRIETESKERYTKIRDEVVSLGAMRDRLAAMEELRFDVREVFDRIRSLDGRVNDEVQNAINALGDRARIIEQDVLRVERASGGDVNSLGVRTRDVEHAQNITNAQLQTTRGEVTDIRNRLDQFLRDANRVVGGIQGELGAVGDAVIEVEGRRAVGQQVLAQETIRTQQAVAGLQGETGAIGQALRDTEARRAMGQQVLAQETIRTQQAVAGLIGEVGAVGDAIVQVDTARAADTTTLAQGILGVDGRLNTTIDATGAALRQQSQNTENLRRRATQMEAHMYMTGLPVQHGPGGGQAGGLSQLQAQAGGGMGTSAPALTHRGPSLTHRGPAAPVTPPALMPPPPPDDDAMDDL